MAHKVFILFYQKGYVQITAAFIFAFIAAALHSEAVAVIYAGRNANGDRIFFFVIAFALAACTCLGNLLASAMAFRACLRKCHRPLTHDDLALSSAVVACFKFFRL